MSKDSSQPILITSALPYANGSIHIGHLVEYIQTDIFVRFLKLTGADVVYLCADDTHGTPIQVKAQSLGIAPEELISNYSAEHQRDFNDFDIKFDYYYSTHSEENRRHVLNIFEKLLHRNHIFTSLVDQYYCEQDGRFLPDRFIRGTCPNPNCNSADQYGDSCEICGLHYEPTELISPRCATCGRSPVRRTSNHYFFRLNDFRAQLKNWIFTEGHLQEEVRKSIEDWLDKGLKDWDISRDGPYFGFLIPGESDKYFYVWLDAPTGYIAVTEKFCSTTGRAFDNYWHNPSAKIYHFIGKDIVYFHTLFWPAMLMGSGYSLPTSVFVHGFLTVNGMKMSKTKGTFISARKYLEYLDPQYLRYYYASKLTGRVDDLDLNLNDFVLKVNSELVNRIVNLASRIAPIISKHLEGRVGQMSDDGKTLFCEIVSHLPALKANYATREFARVTRTLVDVADMVNRYVNESAPWESAKTNLLRAQEPCALGIHALRFISVTLKPILPRMSSDLEAFLNLPEQRWDDAVLPLPAEHRINEFHRLLDRIDPKKVEQMISRVCSGV